MFIRAYEFSVFVIQVTNVTFEVIIEQEIGCFPYSLRTKQVTQKTYHFFSPQKRSINILQTTL